MADLPPPPAIPPVDGQLPPDGNANPDGPPMGQGDDEEALYFDKMTEDEMLQRILKERAERRELQPKVDAAEAERKKLQELIDRVVKIDQRGEELLLETHVYDLQGVVVEEEYKAQLDKQNEKFCMKMVEIEREMNKFDAKRYIETMRLRDRDLRAAGDYYEKERRLRDAVLNHEAELKHLIDTLKSVQQGVRLKGKVSAAHRKRLDELKPRYDAQKIDEGFVSYPSSTASGAVPDPTAQRALTHDVFGARREGSRRSTGVATVSFYDGAATAPSMGPNYPHDGAPRTLDSTILGHGGVVVNPHAASFEEFLDTDSVGAATEAGLRLRDPARLMQRSHMPRTQKSTGMPPAMLSGIEQFESTGTARGGMPEQRARRHQQLHPGEKHPVIADLERSLRDLEDDDDDGDSHSRYPGPRGGYSGSSLPSTGSIPPWEMANRSQPPQQHAGVPAHGAPASAFARAPLDRAGGSPRRGDAWRRFGLL